MSDGFVESPVSSGEDGTALTNTTAATSIIPAARRIPIPVPFFDKTGKWIHVYAGGKISTAGTTPGTLTFDVRFGSTVVFNGGASGTLVTSASNLTWQLYMSLFCRSLGSGTSGTVLGIGRLFSFVLSATVPIMLLPASSPAVGTGFDTTSSQVLDLFATWSVASASNVLTCQHYNVQWPT